MSDIFNVGDPVRYDETFINPDGFVADPSVVSLTITDPSGTATTYVYGASAMVRDDVGKYHYDRSVDAVGVWKWAWDGTGTFTPPGSAAEVHTKGEILVEAVLETVTITVQDATPAPIVGAQVYAYLVAALQASGVTNGLGQVIVKVPPGSYNVTVEKSKVQFNNPYTPIINNTNGTIPQSVTIVSVPLTIPIAATVQKVRLFGHSFNGQGQPQLGMRVEISTVGYGEIRGSIPSTGGTDPGVDPINVLVAPEKWDVTTDQDGYWETDVVAGSFVRVSIIEARYEKTFRVPDAPTGTSLNIRDARPDPGPGGAVGVDSDIPDRNSTRSVS